MTVKEDLHVNAEEFYDQLIEDVLEEISQLHRGTIRKEDIVPGFSFIKGIDNAGNPISIEIRIADKGRCYAVQMEHSGYLLRLRYQIKAISPERIRVVFSQTTEPQRSQPIITILQGKLMAKMRLRDIESRILQNRKTNPLCNNGTK